MIGLLTLGSGFLLLTNPFKSAEAILPFLGVLLMVNGISEVLRIWRPVGRRAPKYNGTDVHDIPYEEV